MIQAIIDKIATLLRPSDAHQMGARLYAACVTQARQPVFYLDYGVADEIGARFELLTFHVALVIERLRSLPSEDARHRQAVDLAQALFDGFLQALDNTLREQGTGDLSVPKKMKQIGPVIYTRMKRWDALWGEDQPARAAYAAETIFADDAAEPGSTPTGRADAFAIYANLARTRLNVDAILAGRLEWPDVPAPDDAVNMESGHE